jgi:PKD repeat protein
MIRLFVVLFCFLPACVSAATNRSIHVEWGYTPPSEPAVAGFKLYQEGTRVCQTGNPAATAMDCPVTLVSDTTSFTLTATFTDGTESPHSAPFPFSALTETAAVSVTTSPAVILSTSSAAGSAPLAVSFDGSGSTGTSGATITAYSWSFGDGAAASGVKTSHTFTSAGTYITTLTVVDSKGKTSAASTPIVVTGTVAAGGTVTAPATAATTTANPSSTTAAATAIMPPVAPHLEAGEVTVGSQWVRVSFGSSYTHPIVIAGPPQFQNSDPCVVRLRNVTATGFDIRLTEWPYQDGTHPKEVIGYLVLEQGRSQLVDGSWIEAGSFAGTTALRAVAFTAAFSSTPVILTSVASSNDAETVAGRISAVGKSGFGYAFSEQEGSANPAHANETIHYVAWEPGTGKLGSVQYEAASATQPVSSSWTDVHLLNSFYQPPIVLADMQTLVSRDPAALRLRAVTASTVQLKVEEEQSLDEETTHPGERVGYLALAPLQTQRLATFTWAFDQKNEATLSGFRILANGQLLCSTDDVTVRQLACTLPQPTSATTFVIQAVGKVDAPPASSNSIVYRP